MSDHKKAPHGSPSDLDVGLIMELHFDAATPTKRSVRIQTEPHDTAEIVSAALAAIHGTAPYSSVHETQKPSPLLSELVEDYKRDRLAANMWTPKTQDENLAVYRPTAIGFR
jgi:hypothetical protein